MPVQAANHPQCSGARGQVSDALLLFQRQQAIAVHAHHREWLVDAAQVEQAYGLGEGVVGVGTKAAGSFVGRCARHRDPPGP